MTLKFNKTNLKSAVLEHSDKNSSTTLQVSHKQQRKNIGNKQNGNRSLKKDSEVFGIVCKV